MIARISPLFPQDGNDVSLLSFLEPMELSGEMSFNTSLGLELEILYCDGVMCVM